MRRHLRRPLLVLAMSAIMVGALVVPAAARDDNGKKIAEGAFYSLGVGGAVLEFGAASPASPTAVDLWNSVRIFGYEDGPSEGQVFCGDVWNVIVTVNPVFDPSLDRAFVDEISATQILDGTVVGATHETPVRWSSTVGILIQAHGTFLPPGTLTPGTHVVKQTLDLNAIGDWWDPEPLVFEVDDSAC